MISHAMGDCNRPNSEDRLGWYSNTAGNNRAEPVTKVKQALHLNSTGNLERSANGGGGGFQLTDLMLVKEKKICKTDHKIH